MRLDQIGRALAPRTLDAPARKDIQRSRTIDGSIAIAERNRCSYEHPPRGNGRRCDEPGDSDRVFPTVHRAGATPVPIPNTEVKPRFGDGTAHFLGGRVARRWDSLETALEAGHTTGLGRRSSFRERPSSRIPLPGARTGHPPVERPSPPTGGALRGFNPPSHLDMGRLPSPPARHGALGAPPSRPQSTKNPFDPVTIG